jgi:hypothetical protein
MLEYWKTGYRDTASLGKWSAKGGSVKFKMDNILNVCPPFHYSMSRQKLKINNIALLSIS